MAELRYNPLLDDWTMVAASRDKRPDMPKDYCPFCAGSGKVPDDYTVHLYANDFPILSTNPPEPDDVGSELYQVKPSYGICDVVLYSPKHNAKLWELPQNHIEELVELWKSRFQELEKDENIQYIFPFENRGAEVGVTMPHPHGQIYSYSQMPLRMRVELENEKKYFDKTGKNLFEQMVADEIKYKDRVLMENSSFIAFIPFFSEYPYGAYIVAKENIVSLEEFSKKHISDLASMLKALIGGFDTMFERDFPYMMGMYNRPLNKAEDKNISDYFRYHIKFFPPLRGANSIKYNASSETGAWAAGNPRRVEECAVELRNAIERFTNGKQ
ncbi:MAG: galactose-1-phosphate uridylyltransferase [Tissierellia bacterium]|nr:galactose-1-phosphate uridylyltransferase [Tissierellia bacterium]